MLQVWRFLKQVYMGALNDNCVTLLRLDMLLNVYMKFVLNHSHPSYTLTTRKYRSLHRKNVETDKLPECVLFGNLYPQCLIYRPMLTLIIQGPQPTFQVVGGGLYHIKVTFPEALWRGERPLALSHYIKSVSITPIKGFFFFKNQLSGSKLSSTQDLNDLCVLCVWSGTPVRL